MLSPKLAASSSAAWAASSKLRAPEKRNRSSMTASPSSGFAPAYAIRRCAHALLAGAHQEHGQHPLVERYLGTLHDGADRDGELPPAVVALDHAGTVRLAL